MAEWPSSSLSLFPALTPCRQEVACCSKVSGSNVKTSHVVSPGKLLPYCAHRPENPTKFNPPPPHLLSQFEINHLICPEPNCCFLFHYSPASFEVNCNSAPSSYLGNGLFNQSAFKKASGVSSDPVANYTQPESWLTNLRKWEIWSTFQFRKLNGAGVFVQKNHSRVIFLFIYFKLFF